jgi:hypothetical protein
MFVIRLDIEEITRTISKATIELQQKAQKAASALAAQTHAHILEKAQADLHSTREKFR